MGANERYQHPLLKLSCHVAVNKVVLLREAPRGFYLLVITQSKSRGILGAPGEMNGKIIFEREGCASAYEAQSSPLCSLIRSPCLTPSTLRPRRRSLSTERSTLTTLCPRWAMHASVRSPSRTHRHTFPLLRLPLLRSVVSYMVIGCHCSFLSFHVTLAPVS